jgi:two-component system response regulator RegX3
MSSAPFDDQTRFVSSVSATAPQSQLVDRVVVGDVVLDRSAHLVAVRGQPIVVPMQEFRLLEVLMANADHVLTSAHLLETLWGPGFGGDPGTLAVHVLRLRNRLERQPGGSRHIRTVRGLGYVFDTNPI